MQLYLYRIEVGISGKRAGFEGPIQMDGKVMNSGAMRFLNTPFFLSLHPQSALWCILASATLDAINEDEPRHSS